MISSQTMAAEAAQRFLPLALIFAVVSSVRRKQEIGGWLMFFYYQIYAGAVISAIILWKSFSSYQLRPWADETRHLFFIIATVPRLLGFLVLAYVATGLLRRRNSGWLGRLRFVFAIELVFMGISLVIDFIYFPSAVLFNFIQVLGFASWLAYFYVSARVHHVFVTHDWSSSST
jgi:magnesium-transporting ATPase (P-type)